MRREFGGRSSSEAKSHMKRSGGNELEGKLNAMSPYQSHEDLSGMLDQHDDGTLQSVEDLDSRVAATRDAAHKAILLHLSRNIVDVALESHASTIALRGCQWLTSSKTNAETKVNGVDLACAAVLCCADGSVVMYDEVASTLFGWLSHPSTSKQASRPVVGKVMEALSLVYAANPQCTVGDMSLQDALQASSSSSSSSSSSDACWWQSFFAHPSAVGCLGDIALGLAATASVTSRQNVKAFINKAIQHLLKRNSSSTAAAAAAAAAGEGNSDGCSGSGVPLSDTIIRCVEALGLLHDRFNGTISLEEAEVLVQSLQGWDKEVSTAVRKLLLVLEAQSSTSISPSASTPATTVQSPTTATAPLVGVSPVGSCKGLEAPSSPTTTGVSPAKNRAAPFELIQFRERSVPIEGYYLVYLLDALRDVVGEGLLNHIAHNPTVRRMFSVRGDLITKMTKEEAAMEKEAMASRKAEKEQQLRERSKQRQSKQSAQRELGYGEEDD